MEKSDSQDEKSTSGGTASAGHSELISLLMGHRHQIFSYIFSQIPNRADAEDVFQEVSGVIWRKIDEFEPGTNFLAWANRIAYWEVKAARKRFAKSKVIFDDQLLESIGETASELQEEVDERRAALEVCLGKLSDRERKFLLTRYDVDGGVDEAAEFSGRSLQAAYRALTRLRRSLFNCVSTELARGSS